MAQINLDTLHNDFRDFILGKKLGQGISREVYLSAQDDKCVIKVEQGNNKMFQNVGEWIVWHGSADNKAVNRWLAPCLDISPCGLFLTQARVEPITMKKAKTIKKLPAFFTDTKIENFGLYKGRVVACDYGTLAAATWWRGAARVTLRKADWWSAKEEYELNS